MVFAEKIGKPPDTSSEITAIIGRVSKNNINETAIVLLMVLIPPTVHVESCWNRRCKCLIGILTVGIYGS